MSTERKSYAVGFLPQIRPDCLWSHNNLKRKLGSFLPSIGNIELGYPSPPMSSPPSPSRPAAELFTGAVSGSICVNPASTTTATPPTPHLSQPGYSSLASLLPPPLPPPPPHSFFRPPFFPGNSVRALYPPLGSTYSTQGLTTASSIAAPGLSDTGISSTRPGRKSKAHVASACINCKRAHLSCDAERPCTRCVASGKQDTCVDVQHKKRGRPRLREEGEPRTEQKVEPQKASPAVIGTGSPSNPRPIASVRHRRTDSLRSLRSQTSNGDFARNIPTHLYAPGPSQTQSSYQQPTPPTPASPAPEVPTAYLDLDFIFLRTNKAFQQIMTGAQDIRGRHLGEIVAQADDESFQDIRARLRAERDGREPAYMPPIVHVGQDPLYGVSDGDVERLTQSFADRTYTWRRNTHAAPPEIFPARVRLAKAESYFVVVTLPSFHPVSPQPHLLTSGVAYGAPPTIERRSPQLYAAPPSASPHGYYPHPIGGGRSPQLQGALDSRAYFPAQLAPQYPASQLYQSFPGRPPSQYHAAEPRTNATAFEPRPLGAELSQPVSLSLQLPPLAPAPHTSSGSSGLGRAGASGQQTWMEAEEGDRQDQSPRKRRRVGIDDVLQR